MPSWRDVALETGHYRFSGLCRQASGDFQVWAKPIR
jgi:hypothetical protein